MHYALLYVIPKIYSNFKYTHTFVTYLKCKYIIIHCKNNRQEKLISIKIGSEDYIINYNRA